MIRINLLTVERKVVAPRRFERPQLVPIVCLLIVIGTAGALGWFYWSLQQQGKALDEEITTAQREQQRLQSVLDQVAQFEQRKAQLEQRVQLIEQLRQAQNGPVHMLDELSRSLPDRLWLTELKQEGTDLTIQGRASSLTALSDFVGNLEGSTYFRRPVEILNSQVEPQAQGDLIRFTVKAAFSPSTSGAD